MKYFKNKDESEDTYFIAFAASDITSSFINYLNSIGGGGTSKDSIRFNSRVISLNSIPTWRGVYEEDLYGAVSVYGYGLPLKVITDFIELMED